MATKYEGVSIELGGEAYTVPPLNFKALRSIGPKLDRLAAVGLMPNADDLSAISEVIHLALVRNYPDLTLERLEDMLDVKNMAPTIEAVMLASGFTRGKAERAVAISPGETSTPPSAPPSDGPGTTSTSA